MPPPEHTKFPEGAGCLYKTAHAMLSRPRSASDWLEVVDWRRHRLDDWMNRQTDRKRAPRQERSFDIEEHARINCTLCAAIKPERTAHINCNDGYDDHVCVGCWMGAPALRELWVAELYSLDNRVGQCIVAIKHGSTTDKFAHQELTIFTTKVWS